MAVIKNTTIYFGVSIIQSLISFLLLPVFTHFLTKAEFGLVSVVNSISGLLAIFFIFGTQAVVSRLYFEYKDDEEKLKTFLGTVFLSKVIWNIALAVIFLLGRNIIFPIIAKDVAFYPFLLIAIGIGFFSTIFKIYQTLQQTQQNGRKYAVDQIAYLVLNNGITVLLLIVFDMKAQGVILGTLIADFLMTLLVFFRLRNKMNLKIDRSILKESFSYSWPIFFHALFGWGLASVNRLILNNIVSVETGGVYTIGFTIAGVVNMVTIALNHSYTPWFFSQMKKEDRNDENIIRFAEFIILVYSILALGLSLFSPEVIYLFINKGYTQAWEVIPFISFGYVFNGLYFFFINIFNYTKKAVKYVPLYSLFCSIINIGLSYILIPKFGMIGSAVATMVSMFVLSLATCIGSKQFIDVGFKYRRMISLILLPFLMSLFVFIDLNLNLWLVLAIKIIYVLICIIILLLVNRKQFGGSIAHQIDNLKGYINGIKGNYKNSK
jgi:O-antigen/teichoic acid export membrane protein